MRLVFRCVRNAVRSAEGYRARARRIENRIYAIVREREVRPIHTVRGISVLCTAFVCCSSSGVDSQESARSGLGLEFRTPRELKTAQTVGDLKSIRLVSWNIERGTHLDFVRSALERERVDLCLLQEVDWNTTRAGRRDVAVELAKYLHLDLSYGVEFEELGQEHGQRAFTGQATLTRLPVRSSRILRFETQSGFWKPHSWVPASVPLMQRRVGSRIALVTELEFQHRPLVVYNVHLESRSLGSLQQAQLDEILADLKRYPTGTPAIIGGDLNSKYFPSAYLRKLEHEGFHSATGERIERTHTIAMALDWIFAKGRVTLENGQVCNRDKGSDHYPIYAELVAE
jgi:endonuclease/exonuclease/phosphatase family metal-dependent hydrolase